MIIIEPNVPPAIPRLRSNEGGHPAFDDDILIEETTDKSPEPEAAAVDQDDIKEGNLPPPHERLPDSEEFAPRPLRTTPSPLTSKPGADTK